MQRLPLTTFPDPSHHQPPDWLLPPPPGHRLLRPPPPQARSQARRRTVPQTGHHGCIQGLQLSLTCIEKSYNYCHWHVHGSLTSTVTDLHMKVFQVLQRSSWKSSKYSICPHGSLPSTPDVLMKVFQVLQMSSWKSSKYSRCPHESLPSTPDVLMEVFQVLQMSLTQYWMSGVCGRAQRAHPSYCQVWRGARHLQGQPGMKLIRTGIARYWYCIAASLPLLKGMPLIKVFF